MATCACGSKASYRRCCGPVVSGERPAESPGALVRARYCAFVHADMAFLLASHHPDTACRFDAAANESWARESQWLGLEILQSSPGPDPSVAFVEFVVRYSDGKFRRQHHERSEFRQVEGNWRYFDGTAVPGQ